MEHLFTTESLVSLLVLMVLEVVLGIDNVIFVSIIMGRLKTELQKKARIFWVISGILMRTILLMGLQWLLQQKGKALFTLVGKPIDLASLVMLLGGLFLIYKTVKEIHHKLEGEMETSYQKKKGLGFGQAMAQIIVIDAVFSFDSIITAGGTAKHIEIMVTAVVFAMIIMFVFSPKISAFVHKHPTVKMLALSFLVMIGISLLVEGFDHEAAEKIHLKNYIYFAMFFSFVVEILNMQLRKKATKPVALREPVLEETDMGDEAK